MKISTTKACLVEALNPFTKLNADTINIIASNGSVVLTALTPNARLLLTPDGFASEGDGRLSVNLKSLKDAAASSPRQEIILRHTEKSLLNIGDSTGSGINIVVQESTVQPFTVDSTARKTNLPTGFSSFLLQTFQAASKDENRRNINGVLVSKDGIVGTDGRQLMVIPLPMGGMSESVTLPPSPAYAALRKFRWISLYTWHEDDDQWACLEGIGFRLAFKTIQQSFPNYRSVIPSVSSLDTTVNFDSNHLDQLKAFLKSIPKSEDTLEIDTSENRIDLHCGDRFVSMPGTSTGTVKARVCCNPEYLLRALNCGHTGFRFNSRTHMPILASGTSSIYLWMPMSGGPVKNENSAVKSATSTTEPAVTKPAIASKAIATIPQNTPTKENTAMSTTTQNIPTVYRSATTAPVQSTETTMPVPVDPLADLTTAMVDLRSMLDSIQTRLLDAAKKLREVQNSQRAKERIYQEATRKLDRIRLAM